MDPEARAKRARGNGPLHDRRHSKTSVACAGDFDARFARRCIRAQSCHERHGADGDCGCGGDGRDSVGFVTRRGAAHEGRSCEGPQYKIVSAICKEHLRMCPVMTPKD